MPKCFGVTFSDKQCCCLICIISVMFLIILGIIIGVSIQSLDKNEIGLEYDSGSYVLNDEKLFDEGEYFIGPGHKFYKFDKNMQEKKFEEGTESELDVRSSDGLEVIIDASFTYKLKNSLSDIISIFHNFTEDTYEEKYDSLARNSIRDTASYYSAYELQYNKSLVTLAMRNDLYKVYYNYWALVDQFYIYQVYLPSDFENSIQETDESAESIESTYDSQNQTKAKSKGNIQKAQEETEVILNNYDAQVYSVQQNAITESKTFTDRMTNERKVMSQIKSQLTFTGKQLMDYIWINAMSELMQSENVQIVANLPKPAALNCALEGC